jgi:hypothetical protein
MSAARVRGSPVRVVFPADDQEGVPGWSSARQRRRSVRHVPCRHVVQRHRVHPMPAWVHRCDRGVRGAAPLSPFPHQRHPSCWSGGAVRGLDWLHAPRPSLLCVLATAPLYISAPCLVHEVWQHCSPCSAASSTATCCVHPPPSSPAPCAAPGPTSPTGQLACPASKGTSPTPQACPMAVPCALPTPVSVACGLPQATSPVSVLSPHTQQPPRGGGGEEGGLG